MLIGVESTVILYPPLGGAEGSLQETSTAPRPLCSANSSIGGSPSINYQFIMTKRLDTHQTFNVYTVHYHVGCGSVSG